MFNSVSQVQIQSVQPGMNFRNFSAFFSVSFSRFGIFYSNGVLFILYFSSGAIGQSTFTLESVISSRLFQFETHRRAEGEKLRKEFSRISLYNRSALSLAGIAPASGVLFSWKKNFAGRNIF